MTPADELRRAAALLRTLATEASVSNSGHPTAHWTVRYQPGPTPDVPPRTDRSFYLDAVDEVNEKGLGAHRILHGGGGGSGRPRAASIAPQYGRYIATMDPTLGLALADWLDAAAVTYDATVKGAAGVWSDPTDAAERDAWVAKQTDQHALAVARQILGTTDAVTAA